MSRIARLTSLVSCLLLVAACGDGGGATDQPDAGPATADAAGPTADAGGCVPTSPATEVCDAVDNDCNGLVDDVDEGMDGLYDCQRIAIFGAPGANGSANFVAWLSSNGSDVVRVQNDVGTTELSADLLAMYDVIILDQLLRTYSPAEAELLRAWVEGGGGLMVLSGYTGAASDYERPNSLLAPIGLALAPPLVSGPVTMFVAHPVTTGLTSVTFSGGFFADIVDGVTGGVNTTVATIAGEPVGIVQQRGAGRVFVWGDEWITFDSEWTALPEIQVFWASILGWLGGFVS